MSGLKIVSAAIGRLVSAWRMVVRRSLANWRLLSTVVLGVLLASAIMAGTVVYFDALRELALKQALAKYTEAELDILVETRRSPTNYEEYAKVETLTTQAIDRYMGWALQGRMRAGRSDTFFLSTLGDEARASHDNARAYFVFMPQLEQFTTLQDGGRLPSEHRVSLPGEPLVLEAIIPSETAQLFAIGVGDRLVAIPYWKDAIPYLTVEVAGVFDRNDLRDEIWRLESSVLGIASSPNLRVAPFYISERAFMDEFGPELPVMVSTYSWLLLLDLERLNARNEGVALANLEKMHRNLAATLSRYGQTTALDNAIKEYDRKLFFSKLPMFVVLILIALVILYYIATLSSLVAEERRGEVALLRSRGASSAQVLAVFVMEGATIVILSVVAGPLLAAGTISMLGYTPAFSDLTGGARLEVALSSGAYMMSALGGVLSFAALLIPAMQASRIGVTRHRQQSARPTTQPAFQRYYADVFLLVISIYLFRRLTEQGSVVETQLFGGLAVSQVLLAMPGLMLVASAMVLLRLFPLVMGLASRLMSSWLPAGVVMGLWQMARNPTHYARLSLLLILTAGLGIFAASFGATLERSFEERVLYSTGSDIRVDGVRPYYAPPSRPRFPRGSPTPTPSPTPVPTPRPTMVQAYEQVEGVDLVSPVFKGTGRDLSNKWAGFSMIALESASFTEVAWFREDFSREPIAELLQSLEGAEQLRGIELPLNASTLGVNLRFDRERPSLSVTALVKNAREQYFTYTLGTPDTRDWTVLEASLIPTDHPLTLVALRIHETSEIRRLQAGWILIDDIRVNVSGQEEIVEPFEDASGWSVLRATPDAAADELHPPDTSFDGASGPVLFSWSDGSGMVTRGIYHGPAQAPLPVLASKSFARATGRSIGEVFEASVIVTLVEHRIPVRLVGIVDLFPTMTTPGQSFLVADLSSLKQRANLDSLNAELRPNQAWLSTTSNGSQPNGVIQGLKEVKTYLSTSMHDRAVRLAESKVDPLVDAGWKALLFIAFAAVLVLSCLGFLVHAYVSFRNRQLQFALLRTVGFSMRQLMTTVWLEQALVIATGMALGTWMGGRLGATIMPFLGHDDWGGRVMPPFVMQVNWGALLITYAAMLFVFAVITLGMIWMIRRISVHRVLRLGEM
jgi:ABC-type lipoprotein release transport system permease subunit